MLNVKALSFLESCQYLLIGFLIEATGRHFGDQFFLACDAPGAFEHAQLRFLKHDFETLPLHVDSVLLVPG